MARGRMISNTISTDKRLNAMSLDAALVYLMAIPQLDRDGLIHGDPVLLWAKVCPRRQDLMPQMQRIISEWVAQELVTVYRDRDELVAYFVGFQKNQAMTHYDREAPSIFATPPGYVRTVKGLIPDEVKHDDKPPADQLRTNSGPTPDEVPTNVIEGNVNQCKESESKGSAPVLAFAEETPQHTPERTDAELTRAIVAKMESAGIGVTEITVDNYVAAAMDYGIHAVLSGIDAAASNGKQHKTSYVLACIRNKAQGVAPKANGTNGNGYMSHEEREKLQADLKATQNRIRTAEKLGSVAAQRDLDLMTSLQQKLGGAM